MSTTVEEYDHHFEKEMKLRDDKYAKVESKLKKYREKNKYLKREAKIVKKAVSDMTKFFERV